MDHIYNVYVRITLNGSQYSHENNHEIDSRFDDNKRAYKAIRYDSIKL